MNVHGGILFCFIMFIKFICVAGVQLFCGFMPLYKRITPYIFFSYSVSFLYSIINT